jgi:hypothetical protein
MGTRNRVIVPARQATLSGGIGSLESIPGPHKSLKFRALKGEEGYVLTCIFMSTNIRWVISVV